MTRRQIPPESLRPSYPTSKESGTEVESDVSAYDRHGEDQNVLPMAAAVKVIASSIAFWVGVAVVFGGGGYALYRWIAS